MAKNIIRVIVAVALVAAVAITIGSVRSQNDQDHARKLEINCVNNLRHIGLSLRIWSGDNNSEYPWNVSTNAGGVKEIVGADKEGFITNAWMVFQVMANELNSPKVLVCPDDKTKTPAVDFAHLTASNVTYRLHVVPDMASDKLEDSKIPLVVCPIDGGVVYYNGDYKGSKPEVDANGHRPMHVQ
jgi:hypothetical protein